MTVHRWQIVAVGLAIAFVVFVASARPLQSAPPQQVPGMIVPGSASVQVTNQPTVQAVQSGAWKVSVPDGVTATLPRGTNVGFDAPDFLEVNHKYIMRWGAGLTGTYTVQQIHRGWALVSSGNSRLWVNTALAIAIEEAK